MDRISLFKKGLAVTIILLFIGMSIPSTGTVVEKKSTMPTFYDGNILYVGGDGPGNYTKIQDAIDDAEDGDTVFVFDDSSPYYENPVVNKTINLIGENKDTTIIDGGWLDVVNITADCVNISRFTITNNGNKTLLGGLNVGLYVQSDYNSIYGNNIINSDFCIRGFYSKGNTIMSNSIEGWHEGIYLYNSSDNTIADNNIIKADVAIKLTYSGGSTNKIGNNIITGNNISNTFGGISLGSCNNTIAGNNISNNWGSLGLHFGASGNNITGNTITLNKLDSISLNYWCNNNIIAGNTISNNGYGIRLMGCSDNLIMGNTISTNNDDGIELTWFSSDNIITNNTISGNHGCGILLDDSSNNTIITDNTITDNHYDGIVLGSPSNTITGNTISNNDYGIKLYYSSDNTISGNIVAYHLTGIYLKNSSCNEITSNNFRRNIVNAFFKDCKNTWDDNYWNRPRLLPKPIFGIMKIGSVSIPWVNFDLRPAREPYDILHAKNPS